jgi:outer membrane protein assembly factor BamC
MRKRKMIVVSSLRRLPALAFGLAAAALAVLAGCSSTGNKSVDYRSSAPRQTQQALEVPPELTNPAVDDRYAIPDPKAQTTYSAYSRDKGVSPSAAAAGVLPKVDGVRLERAGDQRWLVVKAPPDKVWPIAREFWMDMGFSLRRESPEVGIMETDWAENRAKLPQDIVRDTIGKVLDGLWSTSERDKFRTRLEAGTESGTTEIYVSHRGLEEVYTSRSQEQTVWQPRAADRELEAEMLGRMMVKFGAEEKKVAESTARATPTAASAAAAAGGGTKPAAPVAIGNAVLQNAGAGPLVVNDGFDRAWRRVGLALDRVGFTVEDRDRSKGTFFVRYVDPEVDLKDTSKLSWAERLQFWKPAPKASQPQYRISVSDAGGSLSQVEVLNAQGEKESSSTGKKILALLYDQLK